MKTSEVASYQILGETVNNVQIEPKRKDTWPKQLQSPASELRSL